MCFVYIFTLSLVVWCDIVFYTVTNIHFLNLQYDDQIMFCTSFGIKSDNRSDKIYSSVKCQLQSATEFIYIRTSIRIACLSANVRLKCYLFKNLFS